MNKTLGRIALGIVVAILVGTVLMVAFMLTREHLEKRYPDGYNLTGGK